MLEDGVYIGLREADYFGEDALGTTDLAILYEKREGWWWQSRHNPARQQRETSFQAFGSAFHCLLLEGRDAFDSRYYVGRNPADFPNLIQGKDAIIAALEDVENCPTLPARNKITVQRLLEWADVYLPDAPIWERIRAEDDKEAGPRILLDWREGRDLEAMLETAFAVPELAALFGDTGPKLAEISVFHTFDIGGIPVRCRFRFDRLFPQFSVDLKSLQDPTRSFVDQVRKKTGDWSVRLQAGWSYEMRRRAYAAIEEGRIFGGTAAQRKLLSQFPTRAPIEQVRWLWIFFQRPSDHGSAPTVMPIWLSPDDPEIQAGEAAAWEAIDFYVSAVSRWGLDHYWFGAHPLAHGTERDAGPGEFRMRSPARPLTSNEESHE